MTSAAEVVRANGVGASEIAAIIGISPFAGPWEIFARKKGLIEEAQSEEMYWGKMLEPVIARGFSEQMHLPVEWCDKRLYSRLRPWQFASPDAFVLGTDAVREAVLECKTAGLHASHEWDRDTGNEDGMPDYYVSQLQWQMSVTELRLAYCAVLIGGNDFRIYKVEHDPVLEEILLEEGEEFWRRHLMTNTPPPISGSQKARDYLKRRYPREREKLRPATPEEMALLDEYATVRGEFDRAEERKVELETQLRQAVGDAEGIAWPRGKFTWKKTKDGSEVDWEELAKAQLEGFTEAQQKAIIETHTHVVHGVRRIHFRLEDK